MVNGTITGNFYTPLLCIGRSHDVMERVGLEHLTIKIDDHAVKDHTSWMAIERAAIHVYTVLCKIVGKFCIRGFFYARQF